MGLFHELHAQGVTIILVTHEQEIAEQTKRIVRLRDGEVIEDYPLEKPAEVGT